MTVKTKATKAPVCKLENYGEIFDHARLAQRIAEGVNVNARIGGPRSGTPPIAAAARRCDVIAVRMLLRAGATPEYGKKERGSALVEACRGAAEYGVAASAQVCELLVAAGANPNGVARDEGRKIWAIEAPITWAAGRSQAELLEKLHELGADFNAILLHDGGHWQESKNLTPLAYVVDCLVNGNAATKALVDGSVIVALLKLGADDSVLASEGQTAFSKCVALGLQDVVEYYVRERGEDLAQRVNGRTLAQIARTPEMRDFLKSLKSTVGVERVVGSSSPSASPARDIGSAAL
jgi:ankyrin repeat protein